MLHCVTQSCQPKLGEYYCVKFDTFFRLSGFITLATTTTIISTETLSTSFICHHHRHHHLMIIFKVSWLFLLAFSSHLYIYCTPLHDMSVWCLFQLVICALMSYLLDGHIHLQYQVYNGELVGSGIEIFHYTILSFFVRRGSEVNVRKL